MSYDPNIPNESNLVRTTSGDLAKMQGNFEFLEPTASGQLTEGTLLSGHQFSTSGLTPSGARVVISGAELHLSRTGDGSDYEAVLRVPLTSGQAVTFLPNVVVPDPTVSGHAANRGWVLGRDIEDFANVTPGAASGQVLTFDGANWAGGTGGGGGGGGASPNLSGAAVPLSGTSGLVSGQVWTALTWDVGGALYDVSGFTATAQGTRLTVSTAALNGAFRGMLSVEWDTALVSGAVAIRKNGAEFLGMGFTSGLDGRGQQCQTVPIRLVSGDYFEAYAWNGDGVNRSVLAGDRTWFAIERVGDLALTPHTVSIDFNGTDEMMESTEASLNIANQWTVMLWVKRTGVGTGLEVILDIDRGNFLQDENHIQVFRPAGGGAVSDVRIDVWDNAAAVMKVGTLSGVIPQNQWTQLVYTFDGAAGGDPLLAYVSGVSGAINLTTDNTGTMDDAQVRAVKIASDVNFDGSFAEFRVYQVAVWDAVLSSGAVAAIYNGGNPQALDLGTNFGAYGSAANLQHWFRLGADQSADSELGRDWSASGNGFNVSDNQANITTADVVADAPS